MKTLLALIALFPVLANAQSVTVIPDTWDLYRGVRIVERDLASESVCAETARTRGIGSYTCRTQTRVVVESAPSPVDCIVSDWSEWTGGEWGTCQNGSQTRQETHTRTIVTPPANGGSACPLLSETRTVTQPCTSSPPTTGWTHCADQEQMCQFSGVRTVRFGADTRWVEREFTNGTLCNSTTFGRNPAPGALKTCELLGLTTPEDPPPPPPTGTGTATLNWRAPTQNEDNTPLTNLADYRAYCTQGGAVRMTEVSSTTTTAVVDRLASGPWTCYATAFNSEGVESAQSNVAPKVIP